MGIVFFFGFPKVRHTLKKKHQIGIGSLDGFGIIFVYPEPVKTEGNMPIRELRFKSGWIEATVYVSQTGKLGTVYFLSALFLAGGSFSFAARV